VHDLVIRNGKIIDGSGADAFEGDVAVRDGRIVEVGRHLGRGKEEIDAEGRLVTPGFVDVHTHYDAQVSWDPLLTPSSWHGVTSVVMGNCGVGFAPVKPDKRDWLIGLMEGVEDIPGAAMTEGIDWQWESFPEYLDAIAKRATVLDFAAQVPHGAVRGHVMGERGAANEAATADDIAAMAAIVEEGIRKGALGFSTSRTLLHRAIDGRPVPGTFAAEDELLGLANALAKGGGGMFQFAGEHAGIPEEFKWMRTVGKIPNVSVSFNFSQTDQTPQIWKGIMGQLEAAHAEGSRIYGQVAGRAIGVLMCWQGTAHPFVGHIPYAMMGEMPFEARLAKLSDPAVRTSIVEGQQAPLGDFERFVTTSWHKMYPIDDGQPDYEPTADKSVAAIAQRTGRTPQAVAYDHLMTRGGRGILWFPLFNYADNDLELLAVQHRSAYTRMGLSDGGAHCGAICDGGMPTFMLTHWARDRTRGSGPMPLEYVVHRQTRQTAKFYGLNDRGLLVPGYRADINVIDYDRLGVLPPELVFDLPAGGRRYIQKPVGYGATILKGQVTWRDGEHTGLLPGGLVRGQQVDPG
jgi:N-acyl-D-aspartate/D-glutamate deacylase